jgi:hypothetical protein
MACTVGYLIPSSDEPVSIIWSDDESLTLYARLMRDLELMVRELLAVAQQERKAKLDLGRVYTVFKVGDRVLLLTKELLDAADIGKLRQWWDWPFTVTACPSPNAYTCARAAAKDAVQPRAYCQLGPAQALPCAGRRASGSGPCVGPGAGGRAQGGAAAQPQVWQRHLTR